MPAEVRVPVTCCPYYGVLLISHRWISRPPLLTTRTFGIPLAAKIVTRAVCRRPG